MPAKNSLVLSLCIIILLALTGCDPAVGADIGGDSVGDGLEDDDQDDGGGDVTLNAKPTVSIDLSGVAAPDGEYRAWLFFTEYTNLNGGTPVGYIGPYSEPFNITGGRGASGYPYPTALDALKTNRQYIVSYILDVDNDNAIGEADIEVYHSFIPASASSPSVALSGSGEAPAPVFMMTLQSITVTALTRAQTEAGSSFPVNGSDPGKTSYTSTLSESQPYVQLTVSPVGVLTTVRVDGVDVGLASGYKSNPIALPSIDPVAIPIVVSLGLLTRTYTVTVNRPAGTNAEVETVMFGGVEIVDQGGVYQAGVPMGANSASFSISSVDPLATVTFNSVNPISGQGSVSGAYGLDGDDPDVVTFDITSEDGNSTSNYTLEFYEKADSSLSALSLDAGTISFSPTTLSYDVTVPADTSAVVISATAADGAAAITIPGYSFNSGQSSSVTLPQDSTTTVTVRCTNPGDPISADDSVTEYLINIIRPPLWTNIGGPDAFDGELYRGEIQEYNGKLYALGVHGGSGLVEDTSVWEYNPATDTWNVLGSEQAVDGGFYTTMAIDPADGTIYVLSSMQVFKWDGSSWSQLGGTVGTTGTGQYYSLAVHPITQEVYVAYADNSGSFGYKQTVKKWNGSTWEVVGSEGFSTEEADRSELFFFDGDLYVLTGNDDLRLYTWTGAAWNQVDYVNSSSLNDVYTVNDGTDGVYLGYIEGGSTTYQPSVRYYNGSTTTQIGSTRFAPALSYQIALAISPSGALLAGYQTGSDGSDPVMVAYWSGSDWEEMAEVDSFDRMTSMDMIILDGTLYVGYGDGDTDEYRVIKYNGTLP